MNENNIKNNLEFYKQRNDIDSQSEKDIEDITKSIREELIEKVVENFRKKISPSLPTEIFVFQEKIKKSDELSEMLKNEHISKKERMTLTKEYEELKKELLDNYLDLAAATCFKEEIRNVRSVITGNIGENLKELDDKILFHEACVRVLESLRQGLCFDADIIVSEAVTRLIGIGISKEDLHQLDSLIDKIEIDF